MRQALYRKWRPRTFDEVYGQEHITSILKYECANGKFSHAYLFCGSRGTGKTSCAKILAKAVNCENPINGSPCGKCPSCLAIDAGSATDVVEMDAASNNGVDNIRDIRDEVVYSPSMLKYKVYIVDEVHMLSVSAFNALLKTLEEPPAHVIFILATTELHKLPSTIISRCRRFDFRRIAVPVISERLMYVAEKENIKLDKNASFLIAKLAQGGMRDALSLLDLCAGEGREITEELVADTVGMTGRDEVASLVRALHDGDFDKIFDVVAEVVSSSKDIAVFWQDLMSFYRDMLVIKTAKTAENASKYLDLTEGERDITEKCAALFSRETLIYHCKLAEDALAEMQKSNSAKRLCAEMTLVKMCDATLSSSDSALLARISALEDRLDRTQYYAPMPAGEAAEIKVTDAGDRRTPSKAASEKDKEKNENGGSAKTGGEAKPQETKPAFSRRMLPYWLEVIDKICEGDPSLAGFLRNSKTYKNESGAIVLRLDSDFAATMIKARKTATENMLAVLSTYEKRRLSPADLVIEVSHANDVIDEGRESIEEIIKDNNL